jgi:hypothetical protein
MRLAGNAAVAVAVIALAAAVALDGAQRAARATSRDGSIAADALSGAFQAYPYYDYDGRWMFVRIQTNGNRGYRGSAGWAHDYPDADVNLTTIIGELTSIDTRKLPAGGNVLGFEDPRLYQFPIIYVSEPDEWFVTEGEAKGLRTYLTKGGFIIFDDFFDFEMENLVRQMQVVFPEYQFLPLDGTEPVFHSFYDIVPSKIFLQGPRKTGMPHFYGMFEDNDKRKRMFAVAGAGADLGDLWEWSGTGFMPVDPTSEAYRVGINYIMYALTH